MLKSVNCKSQGEINTVTDQLLLEPDTVWYRTGLLGGVILQACSVGI